MTAAQAAKTETPADRYRRIRAQLLEDQVMAPPPAEEPLFDLHTSDGMDWKVRKFKKEIFIAAGMLPTSLSAKIATIGKEAATPEDREEVFRSLSEDEQRRAIIFTSQVARYTAVVPRIVENPQSGNEIGFDEVTTTAYGELVEWAMIGGEEAVSLPPFRGKRRKSAKARAVNA